MPKTRIFNVLEVIFFVFFVPSVVNVFLPDSDNTLRRWALGWSAFIQQRPAKSSVREKGENSVRAKRDPDEAGVFFVTTGCKGGASNWQSFIVAHRANTAIIPKINLAVLSFTLFILSALWFLMCPKSVD